MADFPAAVPALPPLPSYTQADILALFDRLLPSHYLAPLKDPGPGYEYLQAVAKMIERVSAAISHVGSGCYIGSATGGSYATVTVELYRDSAFFGPVTLLGRSSAPQGTLVGTATGYYYQLLSDVTFGATELGPLEVEAQAVTRGWLWNQPGPFYTADGEFVEGPINRLVKPVFPLDPSPPNFDPTIKVRQKYKMAEIALQRASAGVPVSLLAGTVLQTDLGVQFVTTQELLFDEGSLTSSAVFARPVAPVIGTVGTITSVISYAWGTTERAVITGVVTDTPWEPSDASGGISPMLDGIGYDRGLPRNFSGIRVVTFEREGTDEVIILPDTVVSTPDGFHYKTTSTAIFPAGSALPQTASVEPLFLNEPANTEAVSQVISVKWGSTAEPELTVYSVYPQRESDDDYRIRLTFLPKTLTPNAFRAALSATLDNTLNPMVRTWGMREVWDIRYQSAYDFPTTPATLDYANIAVPVPTYNSAVFVYDYVPLDEALSNRYLSGNPERGVVVIRVPKLTSEQNAALYPGLAQTLEQIKPAGASVLYVFGDQ